MKFSIKGFFSKYNQIHSFLQIWSHLLKKYLMGNFFFCAAYLHGIWTFMKTGDGGLEISYFWLKFWHIYFLL